MGFLNGGVMMQMGEFCGGINRENEGLGGGGKWGAFFSLLVIKL